MAWKVTVTKEDDDLEYQDNQSEIADDGLDYDYDEGFEDAPVGLFATPGRIIALVSSVVVLVFVLGIGAWLLTRPAGPKLPVAVRVGAIAPDFQLNDIYDGKPVKLSSLRGNPVWVNFWASWCAPCKAEMPEMKTRYDQFKAKGLTILGVDLKEDNATVRQFTKLNNYDWKFVIDAGPVSDRYVVSGIPTHVFLDKDGVIRSLVVGGISGDMMDQSLAKIIDQ